METLSIGELDRISLLPEPVIHCILSSLKYYPAQLVRMSVLSKTWFHLTASFPFLFFDIDEFTSRQSFFKYVEYTTSRFCHHNLTAHMLTFIATIQQPAELDTLNRCLERLLYQGVKVLDIDVTDDNSTESPSASVKFRLPDILLSVSALESLTVRACELPSSFMLDVTRFKSLIQLTLLNVPIDDQVIKHLTTCCPLLQAIEVLRCRALKRFCVYGHQNLQRVQIFYDTPIEMIHIEAPNLSTFSITDSGRVRIPQIMNLASCKKLTTVSYHGFPLSNSNGFNDFLSNFPFIQNLVLESRCRCNNLKLSSHSLRTLLLHLDCDLEKIELSTPNLVSFTCLPYRPPWPVVLRKQWHILRDSAHLKACMQCYPTGCMDTLWFKKLRRFLDKKNGFKVLNLYIHASSSQQHIGLEKLKAIELPPYALEHVELQLDTHVESSAHVAFIDAVVWCFRPRSLTLRPSSSFIDFEDVAMFTYKKLLEQEDQGHTNIRIVWPSSSEAQKHLRDLKSLSAGLPREEKAISFIKE